MHYTLHSKLATWSTRTARYGTCDGVFRRRKLEQCCHLVVHQGVVPGKALACMAGVSAPQLPQVQGVGHLQGEIGSTGGAERLRYCLSNAQACGSCTEVQRRLGLLPGTGWLVSARNACKTVPLKTSVAGWVTPSNERVAAVQEALCYLQAAPSGCCKSQQSSKRCCTNRGDCSWQGKQAGCMDLPRHEVTRTHQDCLCFQHVVKDVQVLTVPVGNSRQQGATMNQLHQAAAHCPAH